MIYGARISHCRGCPLRDYCQGVGSESRGPRQVSAIWHPLPPARHLGKVAGGKTGTAALLWQDGSRCAGRRLWMQLMRSGRVDLQMRQPVVAPAHARVPAPLSREQRAHWRLSWEQRLARNARPASGPGVQVVVFGVPAALAAFLDLPSC